MATVSYSSMELLVEAVRTRRTAIRRAREAHELFDAQLLDGDFRVNSAGWQLATRFLEATSGNEPRLGGIDN